MTDIELKDVILKARNDGKVTLLNLDGLRTAPLNLNLDGLRTAPLSQFIEQPADGILYDLNRGEEVVLTFLPDPKWINDFAVSQVIRALKNRVEELENELKIKNQ